MDHVNGVATNGGDSQEVLARRDAILGSIAWAAEQFLSASASTWPETVNQVIARVGESLGVKRIFLLKHQEVTAEYVITGLQYEWVREGGVPLKGKEELKHFSLQETGYGRWAGVLYMSGVINAFVNDLPPTERDQFLSKDAVSVIGVPVFIGEQWWGFIGFEDYYVTQKCSQLELNALKTVAVTFGAAIRRKRAEEALQQEKAKIEALAQAQSEFISMASHQLRSPLTSVRWYSERLLKKGQGLTTEQIEMAEVVHKTAVQLAEIVDDLLNLSRIEHGSIALELVEADLNQLLTEVVTELQPQFEAKKLHLAVEQNEKWPVLWFDPKLVREVVINLLSNAIKYTPEQGKIGLAIYREGEAEVKVAVSDSGMGIPEVEKQKIFNRFYRSPQAVSAKIQGTGLGLSVAKLMVNKWGGEIGFTSIEGQGSTFYFTIPIQSGSPTDN